MPSYLDLAVLAIVLISALLALLRGFTREVLAIVSWVAAAALAYQQYKHSLEDKQSTVLEFVKRYISNEKIAIYVAAGGVFLVAMIVISIVTVKLSDLILDSKIGALDRTAGFLFGAARGFLIAVVAFVFYSWLAPDATQPPWVKDARMKPILEAGGDSLRDMIPQDIAQEIETAVAGMKRKKGSPANDEPPAETESGKMGENPASGADKKM